MVAMPGTPRFLTLADVADVLAAGPTATRAAKAIIREVRGLGHGSSKWHTARVIARQELVRYNDYQVDYVTGDILLNHPVPAADGAGNPVYVVAMIERRSGGERRWRHRGHHRRRGWRQQRVQIVRWRRRSERRQRRLRPPPLLRPPPRQPRRRRHLL